jgi:hypothetical protein
MNRRSATHDAHCRELGDLIGDSHQRRNRTERIAGEGCVEAGNQDALAQVDQLAGELPDQLVQKLGLVDADDLDLRERLVECLAQMGDVGNGNRLVRLRAGEAMEVRW